VSERVHVGPEAIGTPLRGPAAITSFLSAKAKMRPSATGLSSASSPSLLATPPLHDPPRTGEEAPKILENDVDHVLASWRHIAIAFWRRETRPDAIERLGLALRALQDATGHAPGLFMVIGESAPLPSAEARALSATVLRRLPLAFSVVTFEGAGFRAAAVRAVVAGISLLAKVPYPYKSFASIEDASTWVAMRTRADGEASVPAKALMVAVHGAQGARAG
jgi:hypothetical protein